MKKFLKVFWIILFIIFMLLPLTYSYAISNDNKTTFFQILKTKVNKDENVEMLINLDQIAYEKFKFELSTDTNVENIKLLDNNDDIQIEANEEKIVLYYEKNNDNIKNIQLNYKIPDDKQVGDKIKFTATITNEDNIEQFETLDVVVEIVEKLNPEEPEDPDTSEEDKEEEQDNENDEEIPNTPNIDDNKKEDENNNEQGKEDSILAEKNVENEKNVTQNYSIQKTSNQNNEETVTYNGSDNNYLSSLSVEGYSLNKEFTKENTTYFLNVESNVENINVSFEAEDADAISYIYGNEELKEGINKVLISVTAENGNIRYYRIYVNKKA